MAGKGAGTTAPMGRRQAVNSVGRSLPVFEHSKRQTQRERGINVYDEQSFVDRIAAENRTTLPQRIYADWLEEQGDDRCELLRSHAELVRSVPHHVWHGPVHQGFHHFITFHYWLAGFREKYPNWTRDIITALPYRVDCQGGEYIVRVR